MRDQAKCVKEMRLSENEDMVMKKSQKMWAEKKPIG